MTSWHTSSTMPRSPRAPTRRATAKRTSSRSASSANSRRTSSAAQLEVRLLDAFSAVVTRAGPVARPLRSARDLVDLVDEDDPVLRLLDGVTALEEQLRYHNLDVLAVVPRLRVLGRVSDDERH